MVNGDGNISREKKELWTCQQGIPLIVNGWYQVSQEISWLAIKAEIMSNPKSQ